jgi:aspartate aminotransferase-like enzyme
MYLIEFSLFQTAMMFSFMATSFSRYFRSLHSILVDTNQGQNQFIAVLTPNNTSVMEGWLYNLINVGVSLCGYYLASFLVDNKLCNIS